MKNDFSVLLKEVLKEVEDMLIQKNTAYGDSYFETRRKYGIQSLLIRLEDKQNRLFSLIIKAGGEGILLETDESIEDTIKDIAGYCLLELIYRRLETKCGQ
ncbi:hypothetical protein [Hydrogenobacter thermophilus]|jgi:hypothetical protein|uniref:hypothetical protein n=1 Tax=Hydrogenobacter thermophilus TaxID=940 RepID=UPI0030F6E1AC